MAEQLVPGASEDESRRWAVTAAQAAADKQANDILVLHVGSVLAVADWFVICDAANPRQVKTVVEEIEKRIADVGGPKPRSIEGLDARHWVLMDFGDLVVHVFQTESRSYYELERLWSDVPRLDWEEERATG